MTTAVDSRLLNAVDFLQSLVTLTIDTNKIKLHAIHLTPTHHKGIEVTKRGGALIGILL